MRKARRLGAVLTIATIALGACGGDDQAQDTAGKVQDATADDEFSDEEVRDVAEDAVEDAGQDDGGLPDPCVLVTEADAAGLFGTAVRHPADATEPVTGTQCLWENVGSDELGNAAHLLQVHAYPTEDYYSEEIYDGVASIDGLGDRACSATSSFDGVTVQWVQDGRTFSLDYSIINVGVDEAARVEASAKADAVIALARQASTRL